MQSYTTKLVIRNSAEMGGRALGDAIAQKLFELQVWFERQPIDKIGHLLITTVEGDNRVEYHFQQKYKPS